MVRRLHHYTPMIHTLECPDDEKPESFSALLKDVSDENLKKLRAKTVRKVLADMRQLFLHGGVMREKKNNESAP